MSFCKERRASQNFTGRLRHFTEKSVSLHSPYPPFFLYMGKWGWEERSALLKDSALVRMLSAGFQFTACPLRWVYFPILQGCDEVKSLNVYECL